MVDADEIIMELEAAVDRSPVESMPCGECGLTTFSEDNFPICEPCQRKTSTSR